jgi:transcriptional regulator with XRE-family HTH domain
MDTVGDIGRRIRELREIAGRSAESVAREIGVPTDQYEAWESGTNDIPVGVLFEIANRFQVDLTDLITGEGPRLKTYCVTRSGRGPQVPRRTPYRYWSLAHNFLHKKADPFLVEVAGESAEKPLELNAHPGQEFDYVIEGRLLVSVGGHEVELAEGDSLYFDSSQSHGMKALGGKRARFLAIIL